MLRRGAHLFPADKQYNITLNILQENCDELNCLHLAFAKVIKGVAIMVSAGCTVSPPIVSICIRAGWLVGGR